MSVKVMGVKREEKGWILVAEDDMEDNMEDIEDDMEGRLSDDN